jgi:predicted enzyme related to lactoylglutathione lyase
MSTQVTHFEIDADEPRRLPRFYKELVGRDVVKTSDADCFHIHLTPAQTELRGGVRLRPLDSPRSWMSCVLVESIDDTLRAVVRLGGHVIHGAPREGVVRAGPGSRVFVVNERDPAAAADACPEEALAFEW